MYKLRDSSWESILTSMEITDEEFNKLNEHRKELYRKVGTIPEPKKKEYSNSCHLGDECGIVGLSCSNPCCPHT